MVDIPLCTLCKNLMMEQGMKCKAYPGGGGKIPDEIAENEVYHVLPFEGDNGILFQPYDGRIDVQAIIDIEKERRAKRARASGKGDPDVFEEMPCAHSEAAEARKKPGHDQACVSGSD